MNHKSSAEFNSLDFSCFIQQGYGGYKGRTKKELPVKTLSAVSKETNSSCLDKKGRIEGKRNLPLLNLTNVRRHVLERAELTGGNLTGVENGDKGDALESRRMSYQWTKRHSTVEGRERDRKSSVAAPVSLPDMTFKDGSSRCAHAYLSSRCLEGGQIATFAPCKGEFSSIVNMSSIDNRTIQSREKVMKHSHDSFQIRHPAHLPISSGELQTARKYKSENVSKNGSFSNRTVEGRVNGARDMRGLDIGKLSLELGPPFVAESILPGGLKQRPSNWGTVKASPQNSRGTFRDSVIAVQTAKLSTSANGQTVASRKGYSAARSFTTTDRGQLEDRIRNKLKCMRQAQTITAVKDACQRVGDEIAAETVAPVKISCSQKEMSANHNSQSATSRAPRLNFSNFHTCGHIGFGGNQVENLQSCRTSRVVVAEASPRLVVTERSTSRKSSMSFPYQKQENIDMRILPFCSPGAYVTAEMLRQCESHLTEFEQHEIVPYNAIYFLGLGASKVQARRSPGSRNHGYDDERGDYIVVEHDHLAYRYEVLGILGKGSFGQVLKCMDHRKKLLRAVKVIRNKSRFYQQALVEVKILEHLRQKALDEPSNFNIVMMHESFHFRGHLCIVFELHDISLYELLKRNNFQGLSLVVIKSFASQLLATLRVLRKLHVIHCDLKPENILLEQPVITKIKVIDFGSSCFCHERSMY